MILIRLHHSSAEVELVYDLLSDQPVSHYKTWASERLTLTSVKEMLTDSVVFAIFHDRCFVGVVGYQEGSTKNSVWLHYIIDKTHTGKGIATLAVFKLIDVLQKHKSSVKKIEATVSASNKGSLRVLEKAGFNEVGRGSKMKIFEYLLNLTDYSKAMVRSR